MRLYGSGVTFTFGVKPSSVEGITVTGEDRAASAAPAPPGEPDAVENVAANLSTRLLDAHGADFYPVKGHAA